MFFLSKLHTLLVIVGVWFCALFVDCRVPYFPIEISRTAASGPTAHSVFIWGTMSVGATLLYETYKARHLPIFRLVLGNPLMLWPIVMIIAWFDDTRHFYLHNTAVVGMLGMVAAYVFLSEDANLKVPVYVSAIALGLPAICMGPNVM